MGTKKDCSRIAGVGGMLLLAVWTLGATQEKPGPLDELRAALETLRKERAAYYERQRGRESRLQEVRAAARKFESDLAELRVRESVVDRELAEVQKETDKLRREEEASEAAKAKFGPETERLVKRASQAVEAGIPYRKEDRLARLKGESAAASFGAFWSFLQEELRIARSGEAFTAEVPLGEGRTRHARLVRVGHHFLGYVTEDGAAVGLWSSDGWKPAAPSEAKSIRQAVEILDRRQSPALVPLPVRTRKEGDR